MADLLRFIHHFSTIDTQEGVYHARGVDIRFKSAVTDLGFAAAGAQITVESIECSVGGSSMHGGVRADAPRVWRTDCAAPQ